MSTLPNGLKVVLLEDHSAPIIQAEILLFSFEFILINLLVDLLYAAVNPTIRYK